ncbi:MAG: hypothetical protein ACKVQA_10735 [Burkholderiales bacterium]
MNPLTSPPLTDLYQLTMLQAYFDHKMNDEAVFELFVRKLPPHRNFLVAAGLEQVLDFLEALHFTEEELAWLRQTGRFTPAYLKSLESLSFTGDVHAMPEGTTFFPDEPIVRVAAPMRAAQLVESRLMNIAHFHDTEGAAAKLIPLASKLAKDGIAISGVRLDSGGLAEHARQVRTMLDAGGLTGTRIVASGNLDEYKIQDIMAEDAPIDGFGVGTSMDTSSDRPFMDCAYKLQEYGGRPTHKRSEGKATWPGRKQVYRFYNKNREVDHDIVTLESAPPPRSAQPLVRLVMRGGRRASHLPTLEESRKYAAQQVERLPARLHSLEEGDPIPVTISGELRALRDQVDARLPLAPCSQSGN